ncbi:P-type DNA transfer ATPase VirB11, partial [Campylobacter jejuni]
ERMQIVIPPATKSEHISITIRKPSKTRFKMEDHIKSGLFEDLNPDDKNKIKPSDEELIKLYEARDYQNFISKAVSYGKNIIIAGETGSGKTTFMKTLIDFISLDDRIITIEDVEEIKFYEHKNFVQLFYPSEAKSTDFLNSATLLKSCLRMKPDRILLAELRGAETYDFINVLASGHGGSITSCHAGSPEETFTRLALMTLQNPQGQCVPFEIIQKTLKDLIDIVVHIHAHHGKRRISGIYFKEMER